MPDRNGQGPMNAGPMTGRGRGFCKASGRAQNDNETIDANRMETRGNSAGCRGPMGCGTGRKGGGMGGGMKGRGRQR